MLDQLNMSIDTRFNDGQFPTLWKLTTVKKPSGGFHKTIWKIETIGDQIKTQWYYEGGKVRQPTTKRCKAKNLGKRNALTAEESALRTAKTTWVKKVLDSFEPMDPGYEELIMEVRNTAEGQGGVINNIASRINSVECLENSQYTSSRRVYPMLAIDHSKVDSLKYPAYIQPKYDGVRCIAIVEDDRVLLQSRSGKQYQGLPEVRSQLMGTFPTGTILDGELFSSKGHLKTVSIVRRQAKRPGNEEDLVYHVFDLIPGSLDPDMNQEDRFNHLTDLLNSGEGERIHRVPHWIIESDEEFEEHSRRLIAEGFEGSIVRWFEGVYLSNGKSARRSTKTRPFLVKYKEFIDQEFKIVGFSKVVGGTQDGAVVLLCETESGKQFKAKPDGSVDKNRDLFEKGESLIGKLATVVYQELSTYGVPRFPIVKSIRDYE